MEVVFALMDQIGNAEMISIDINADGPICGHGLTKLFGQLFWKDGT
jgi:hypothetical protein